jgi:hypothetical protein
MKKNISLTIILILVAFVLKAQKNEYRYWAIKTGITHNYNFFAGRDNLDVMLRTVDGDMFKTAEGSLNYIPGGSVNLFYHMDSKTDKYGFIIGLEAQNNGFRSRYVSVNKNYWIVDQYRVQAVGLPFIFKFGGSNIYINQKYFFIGIEYNYYIVSQNIQRASWNSQIYSHALSTNEKSKSGVASFFGFNYNIFNFQIEFWTSNFINPDYIVLVDGTSLKPYSHIPGYNFFLKTSITIPLNRWITTKNWTAEKIRRMFNGK